MAFRWKTKCRLCETAYFVQEVQTFVGLERMEQTPQAYREEQAGPAVCDPSQCSLLDSDSPKQQSSIGSFRVWASRGSHTAAVSVLPHQTPDTHHLAFTTGFVVYTTPYTVIKNLLLYSFAQYIHYKTFQSKDKNSTVRKYYREWI